MSDCLFLPNLLPSHWPFAVNTPVGFPAALPVSQRIEEVAALVAEHPVVILAGETGSGKTTQLPKLCYALGLGEKGWIGCTQPRRIAARSVAQRLAEELDSPLGDLVGYKIRFQDRLQAGTQVKVMTDGVLLSELQRDPLLKKYAVIIIDEAHERSLNIDLLLGYLKHVLAKRDDLKVIVTSATIDTQAFSRHFNDAPIIEVSGRTYPVDVRYRPYAQQREQQSDEELQHQAVWEALQELAQVDPFGDVLVFLVGERDIKACQQFLVEQGMAPEHLLPLYAQLPAQAQAKVFQTTAHRRVILSTNVAETSLTVPGIRFVIDLGLARISRYSVNHKIQQLPIEPISQAAANQRKGRCGRVNEGICIRLYDEASFGNRETFTQPEILRTDLANVVMQLIGLGFKDLDDFPFIETPTRRLLNDGYQQLVEIHAVENGCLTDEGKQMQRLPIEPKMSKILLSSNQLDCVGEALVMVALMAIQSPKIVDKEKPEASANAHKMYVDERSDFGFWLNVWHQMQRMQSKLSRNKFKKWAQQQHLSANRLREWVDVEKQLRHSLKRQWKSVPNCHPLQVKPKTKGKLPPAQAIQDSVLIDPKATSDKPQNLQVPERILSNLHQALLSGLLSNVAHYNPVHAMDQKAQSSRKRSKMPPYEGTRGKRLAIARGSVWSQKKPQWIVAAELIKTHRVLAHRVAEIDVAWIEKWGKHLLKQTLSNPYYQRQKGRVSAYETLSLWGLEVVSRRRINYGAVAPVEARKIYLQQGLVQQQAQLRLPFFRHNQRLLRGIKQTANQARRLDWDVDEHRLFDFYDARIPSHVVSTAHLLSWFKQADESVKASLKLKREDVVNAELPADFDQWYPKAFQLGDELSGQLQLPMRYRYAPNTEKDGICYQIPQALALQLQGDTFDWLAPAYLKEKLTIWLKALPKNERKKIMPMQGTIDQFLQQHVKPSGSLIVVLKQWLWDRYQVITDEIDFAQIELPAYLIPSFEWLDDQQQVVGAYDQLSQLQQAIEKTSTKVQRTATQSVMSGHTAKGLECLINQVARQWVFGDLPDTWQWHNQSNQNHLKKSKNRVSSATLIPSVVPYQDGVTLQLLLPGDEQCQQHRQGIHRLLSLNWKEKNRYIHKQLTPGKLCLGFAKWMSAASLKQQLADAALHYLLSHGHEDKAVELCHVSDIRTQVQYQKWQSWIGQQWVPQAQTMAEQLQRMGDILFPLQTQLSQLSHKHVAMSQHIQQVLNALLPDQWLVNTPWVYLQHYPRYLTMLMYRMEKCEQDPTRDQRLQSELSASTQLWQQWQNATKNPRLSAIYWMWFELNVSTFAQQLGTPKPVSDKRLHKAIAQARV